MKTQTEKRYWSSLAELEGSPEFQASLAREFPEGADTIDGVDRRRFLQLMGASVALAGAQSCRWEKTNILPLAERPEGRLPGIPSHFATAFELHGIAQPLVVTAYDGRPIKVEGNGLHPQSLGASTIHAQAAILELYDPDRSQVNLRDGEEITAGAVLAKLTELHSAARGSRGAGLAILVEDTSSPALQAELAGISEALPQARVVSYEPTGRANSLAGSRLALGRESRVHPDFSKADRVLALDCDFLVDHPGAIANSKSFAVRRKPESDVEMNRLYAVESRFTATGAQADHRLPLRASQIGGFLLALEARLEGTAPAGELGEDATVFLDALAEDLGAHPGRCAILVGENQPAEVHALAYRVNQRLGAAGETLIYTDEPERSAAPDPAALADLVAAMNSGSIETIALLGGNPVYDAPRGLGFTEALAKVPTRLHLGLYLDETGAACNWHLPKSHFLESFGDALAWVGSHCLIQPLINPLYPSHAALEVLHLLRTGSPASAEQLTRDSFERAAGTNDDKAYGQALHDGFLSNSASDAASNLALRSLPALPTVEAEGMELVLHASSAVRDGRFANSGWLQELPDFLTKLTWDNAAMISPATAAAMKLTTGDEVLLEIEGRSLKCGAYVHPGLAPDTVSLALGYGRSRAGHVGGLTSEGVPRVGFDAYALTGETVEGFFGGLAVKRTGGTYAFASTQEHNQIDPKGRVERDGGQNDGKVERVVATADHGDDHDHDHEGDHDHSHDHAPTFESGKPGRIQELIREATIDQHKEITSGLAALAGSTAVMEKDEHGEDSHAEEDHGGDSHAEGEHAEHDEHGGGHFLEPNPYKREVGPELESLWKEHSYEGRKWGMTIDLSACTGCNACVVACQSENNIPVVGKEQVSRGREMQWIRIDTYFSGAEDAPEVRHQPMACIQCELAPCEQVCPVAATVHSDEGLNDMVYNRCIGTRYCSNNCPTKVRRFNFFNYHKDLKSEENAVKKMGFNPEVTVRHRGVMEKCTYCVQRIQNTKIRATAQRRELRDGEIETACQQTCPADAIVFGDLADSHSAVSASAGLERSYHLLGFLNIKPRTSYLARITNPNPALA